MLKLVKIRKFWYAAGKDELRCSDTLNEMIDTWRPVIRLPRPVFLALAAEFGEALRNVSIEEVPSISAENDMAPETLGGNVTEVALEDVTVAGKYVTYHVVVTAKEQQSLA
jgi:hypothetical protein